MNIKSIAIPTAILFSLLLTKPQSASADILLNTMLDPFNGGTSGADVANTASPLPSPMVQSIAIGFSSGSSETITQIKAYLYYIPSWSSGAGITLGIMADSSGVPSGVFQDSTHLTLTSNSSVNIPVNWSISAGNYWLVAIADSGTFGSWQTSDTNVGTNFATTWPSGTTNTGWQSHDSRLPEAEITGIAAPRSPNPPPGR